MKAMILAAGRGERMRPLTDSIPKPLLTVNGTPLIEFHIRKLVNIGITEIVINLAWQGDRLVEYLQDGKQLGALITYSWEKEGALETAGGIIKALPLLSSDDSPFLVINGDIYFDDKLTDIPLLPEDELAHFWLTQNPEHHPNGDFYLTNGKLSDDSSLPAHLKYTYSGIGLFRPSFFDKYIHEKAMPLAPLMREAIAKDSVSGRLLVGGWTDVGTPERLQQINDQVQGKN